MNKTIIYKVPEPIFFEFLNTGFVGLSYIDQSLQNIVELHIDDSKYAIRFPNQLSDAIPSFSVLRKITNQPVTSSRKRGQFKFVTKGDTFPATKGYQTYEVKLYFKGVPYLITFPAELEYLIPQGCAIELIMDSGQLSEF